ncbi:MAG: hypothetical protein DIU78_014445 [Pseudomonadota bacterium]
MGGDGNASGGNSPIPAQAGEAGAGGDSAELGSGGASGASGAGGDGHDGGAAGGPEEVAGAAGQGDAGAGNVPECSLEGHPKDEPCLVADDYAVFVAPSGDDTATGSRAAPLASVAAAVERALDENKIVIVCAKTFSTPLTLGDVQGAQHVSIYGGFDCDDEWKRVETRSVFAPGSGPALRLESIEGSLLLSGFEFHAADATESGQSSIAAVVKDVENVTFEAVRFVAGDGMDGAPGESIPPFEKSAYAGFDADETVGGSLRNACSCPGTAGGRGGDATAPGAEGATEGLPSLGGGAAGLANASCSGPGTGGDGANGSPGSPGASADSYGALDAENAAWQPASGQPGGPGTVGQGGGGGRGGATGGGGGGACGGCGGQGGGPGQGGGASIGLLVVRSKVLFEASIIDLGDGGNGGKGAPGQEGQKGGVRGARANDGCDGGDGGKGGAGGPGGGGAGGIVVGVAKFESTVDGMPVFNLGKPGEGGEHGDPSEEPGTPGMANPQYDFSEALDP